MFSSQRINNPKRMKSRSKRIQNTVLKNRGWTKYNTKLVINWAQSANVNSEMCKDAADSNLNSNRWSLILTLLFGVFTSSSIFIIWDDSCESETINYVTGAITIVSTFLPSLLKILKYDVLHEKFSNASRAWKHIYTNIEDQIYEDPWRRNDADSFRQQIKRQRNEVEKNTPPIPPQISKKYSRYLQNIQSQLQDLRNVHRDHLKQGIFDQQTHSSSDNNSPRKSNSKKKDSDTVINMKENVFDEKKLFPLTTPLEEKKETTCEDIHDTDTSDIQCTPHSLKRWIHYASENHTDDALVGPDMDVTFTIPYSLDIAEELRKNTSPNIHYRTNEINPIFASQPLMCSQVKETENDKKQK